MLFLITLQYRGRDQQRACGSCCWWWCTLLHVCSIRTDFSATQLSGLQMPHYATLDSCMTNTSTWCTFYTRIRMIASFVSSRLRNAILNRNAISAPVWLDFRRILLTVLLYCQITVRLHVNLTLFEWPTDWLLTYSVSQTLKDLCHLSLRYLIEQTRYVITRKKKKNKLNGWCKCDNVPYTIFTARLHCSQCRALEVFWLSVRLSVTFHVSRWMKIRSCGFQHLVGQSL